MDVYLDNEKEKAVTPEVLIASAVGKNEMGLPQTKVGLFLDLVDYDGNIVEQVRDVSALDPIVSIAKTDSLVTVDLIFASKEDVYFSLMSDLMLLTFDNDTEYIPSVSLCLVPEKFKSEYYMLGAEPLFWAVTAQNPREELNTLRFVFEDVKFYFLQNDETVMNTIAEETATAQAEEQRKAERLAQKEEERKKAFLS